LKLGKEVLRCRIRLQYEVLLVEPVGWVGRQ
jgi:hypothetical protein